MVPEKPVRCVATISNVVEKHVQLFIIVKIGNDDCANGRGSSKPTTSNVLQKRAPPSFDSSNPTENIAVVFFVFFFAKVMFSSLTRN